MLSIGVPVYNGGSAFGHVLGDLLAQTHRDLELIVSDNASTDETERICREVAARDLRVRYIRQPVNIGPVPNFELLLREARGRYFMWAAADDRWEPEFVAANLEVLERDPGVVSSVSRVRMTNIPDAGTSPLRGPLPAVVHKLLAENAGNSRYYGIWRTDVLRDAVREGSGAFIAADWAIVIAAASRGSFHEVPRELMRRGDRGASTSWRRQMSLLRARGVDRVLPLWPFTRWLHARLGTAGFLRVLPVVLLRNLSISVHYWLELAGLRRTPGWK